MAEQRVQPLPSSLQESVLTVLAMDDQYGSVVAGQVRPEHFDGMYNSLAQQVLRYRRDYGTAPGRVHLEEMITGAGEERSQVRRVVGRLVAQAPAVNAKYVAQRAGEFVRGQILRTALVEASDRFVSGAEDEGLVADVEAILLDALRTRQEGLDAGTFLSDTTRGLTFLDRRQTHWPLNIQILDQRGIGPVPGTHLLYIAPKGTGKSWFCVHVGRQAMLHRARVVHISLEMDEDEVTQRYYQSMFDVARYDERVLRAELEFDELHRLSGFRRQRERPTMSFSRPEVRQWLVARARRWGTRLGRLVIKRFPSGALTVVQLRGYLDYLEAAHRFVPDVLLIDYPDLMAVDRRNYRLDLGRTYVDLRGLAVERNMAVVTPTQGNRSSLDAKEVSSGQVSEDISKVQTADNVLTYSQTKFEAKLGLARLHVAHARGSDDGQTILMSQSYATGQYVRQSAWLNRTYWERLAEAEGEAGIEDDVPPLEE